MSRRKGLTEGRDTLVDAKKTRLGISDRHARAADLCGQVVNNYLVEAELGAGAMGTVYLASHIDTHQKVAIKALHSHLVTEKVVVERFHREAKLASRISHPNLGGVIELGSVLEDGRHVIVLELVEGEPLSSILTMPLAAERVLELTTQLLRGLEHAHDKGLVHRDLKPDNVIVDWRDGIEHVRIVDWGIAIVRNPDESSLERLTANGQIIGTPAYMSPEQAKGDSIDHRADLFALGVMVYEMFTGVLPFEGRAIEILHANMSRDPLPMGERVKGLLVDPLHEAFARRLMARDRKKRFATATSALEMLERMVEDPDGAALALGRMNVPRALDVVMLPDPPAPKGRIR
ncbi:MAG: serine/threonine-protein kinase [Kofleriaceae bacterium]|nr:serine/threonine-protein kinase [Kofleriaceae bacterium]